jgi:Tol biopolymer transport system component
LRSNYRDCGGEALTPWVLAAALLLVGASSCSSDASVGAPTSNPTTAASSDRSPVTSPTSSPASEAKELGIFAEVGGWIAYGNDQGIWAVKPTPGGARSDRIHLSEYPGEVVAWTSNGSKLLIAREMSDVDRGVDYDLFFLNADGTETRLTWDPISGRRGSISPDGSKVVDGAFSPDGTQIAYFDGMGDWGNSLRVKNADGSDVRALIDQEFGHVDDLAWSQDGSRLAFDEKYGGIWIVGVDGSGLTEVVPQGDAPRWSPTGSRLVFQSAGGIWVIHADGSGLRQVAPVGREPVWSPNGSRIAYLDESSLYVADLDGTHVRTMGTVKPAGLTPMVWIPQ